MWRCVVFGVVLCDAFFNWFHLVGLGLFVALQLLRRGVFGCVGSHKVVVFCFESLNWWSLWCAGGVWSVDIGWVLLLLVKVLFCVFYFVLVSCMVGDVVSGWRGCSLGYVELRGLYGCQV